MTEDSITLLKGVFASVYNLFTGFIIPGTTITPLSLFLGLMGTLLAITVLKKIFNAGIGIDTVPGTKYGNGRNPNTYNNSSERRNDTK